MVFTRSHENSVAWPSLPWVKELLNLGTVQMKMVDLIINLQVDVC